MENSIFSRFLKAFSWKKKNADNNKKKECKKDDKSEKDCD